VIDTCLYCESGFRVKNGVCVVRQKVNGEVVDERPKISGNFTYSSTTPEGNITGLV